MRKIGFLVFICRLLSSGVFAQSTYPGCDTPDITIGDQTISACNVGTNIAGTGTDSYGSIFQRGNNYGFPSTGDVTILTGYYSPGRTIDNRPSTVGYGPDNYYYDDNFVIVENITRNHDWSKEVNDNLWGGTGSEIERKGPCETGYHLPNNSERQELIDFVYLIGGFSGTKNGNNYILDNLNLAGGRDALADYLLLPLAGSRIYRDGVLYEQNSVGSYWASVTSGGNAYRILFGPSFVRPQSPNSRSRGFSIRCFKNTTPPTQTGTCTNLPANAEWNTTGSILQTRDYTTNNFLPTLVGSYNTTSSTTECIFQCYTGYQRNGTNCTLPRSTNGGGGGGSVNLKQDNCPNGDFSPSYYDGTCGDQNPEKEKEEAKNNDTTTPETPKTETNQGETGIENDIIVSDEILSAYDRAFKHNITTLAPLDTANPQGTVIRGHLAKMIVNYAINVLGRTLPEKVPATCYRKDGNNARESNEIKDYAIKACQLGLMGIDMNYFQPNATVTRAQFGTILSRLLWQNTYAGGSPYYVKHLQALKENGILTQIDKPEQRLELRQRVWLMLMRSAK